MFEKLKEYGLYIILGLAALGALSYMYITTQNTNKGADFRKNIQYTYIDGVKLKDEIGYKNKTVLGLLEDINGKTFDGRHIDGDSIYLINQDGLLAVEDGRLARLLTPQQVNKLYYSGNPAELKLFLIPLVNSNLVDTNNLNGILELREDEINEINTSGGLKNILENLNGNGSQSSGDKNIKDLSDFSRGYIGEGYFGLGLFDNQQDAIDFAHDYFSGAEVVQVSDNGKYGVFFEIVGGGSTANYNIDTLRCDGVIRETQNQLDNKTNQVNELLARELDYINTINEKNQALIDKEQEKNTAVNQCLQQKQEALEAKDAEKTEAINACNTEKNEAIAAKEAEKTAAVNQCNTEKTQIQTQLTQKTQELNAINTLNSQASGNIIMSGSNFYQWNINQDNNEYYQKGSIHNRFSYTIGNDYYFGFLKDYECWSQCSRNEHRTTGVGVITFKLTSNGSVSVVQNPTMFRNTNGRRDDFVYEWYLKDGELYLFITGHNRGDGGTYRKDGGQSHDRIHYFNYYIYKLTTSGLTTVTTYENQTTNCGSTRYQGRSYIRDCWATQTQNVKNTYGFNDSNKTTNPQYAFTQTNKVYNISQYVIGDNSRSRANINLVFTWK